MNNITGKDVAALLHNIHGHDEKTEEIIYKEKDLIPVLIALGLPEPEWELSLSIEEWKKQRINQKKYMTEREMFEKSFQRPKDYLKLSPARQWEIDKELGILDWQGEDLTLEDEKRLSDYYEK